MTREQKMHEAISSSELNYNFFCCEIENFTGFRNIHTTDDFKIANDALDRLFKDLEAHE